MSSLLDTFSWVFLLSGGFLGITGAHVLAKAALHGGLKPLTDANVPQAPAAEPEHPQGESPSTP